MEEVVKSESTENSQHCFQEWEQWHWFVASQGNNSEGNNIDL